VASWVNNVACIGDQFPVASENDASDPLTLLRLQSLTAGDTLSKFDAFFSRQFPLFLSFVSFLIGCSPSHTHQLSFDLLASSLRSTITHSCSSSSYRKPFGEACPLETIRSMRTWQRSPE
jgi:hypothetical protein